MSRAKKLWAFTSATFALLLLVSLPCQAQDKDLSPDKRFAAAEKKLEKLQKETSLASAGPVIRELIEEYEHLANGVEPYRAYAKCRAGVPSSVFAELEHNRLLTTRPLKSFRFYVRLIKYLDQMAEAKYKQCPKGAAGSKLAKYSDYVAKLRKRRKVRWKLYSEILHDLPGKLANPPTKQPNKTKTWLYSRCKAADIILKGRSVRPKGECASLLKAEVRRLTKRARIRHRKGLLVDAEDYYSRALALDSDHKPARRGRAMAFASMGLILEALDDIRWWQQKLGVNSRMELEQNVSRVLKKRKQIDDDA